jgi:hypothetical protein
MWAKDRQATYSHSGVIKNEKGETIEALWKVKTQNIFEAYKGQKILIARPTYTLQKKIISREAKIAAVYMIIKEYEGESYPGWRLFLHIFPVFAKYIHFVGKPVCSELTCNYLSLIDTWWPNAYWGLNPDTLADEARDSWRFQIIFEGIVE